MEQTAMRTDPISLPTLYWRSRGILVWGLLACLIAVLAAFAFSGGKAERLAGDRMETVATVTEVENYWGSSNSVASNARGQSVRKFDLTFVFQTESGHTIEGEKHGPDASREIAVGETFPVWYSASDPDVFELAIGHQERNTSAVRILAVIFASIFAVFFLYLPLLESKRFLRIRDSGEPTSAVVIAPRKQSIDGGLGEHLHWQVKGQQPQHSDFPVAKGDRPEIGQTINVFQLDEKSVWTGESGPQTSR